MKKLLLSLAALLVLGFLAVGSAFFYFLVTGPRMKEQPHIRTYQAVMPLPPEGTVPVNPPVTVRESAARLSAGDAARGKIYYAYYCLFCHGEKGEGRGPVGESYAPSPGDLRTDKVRGLTPQQLLKAMLTGTGHEPVLERVVHPGYRSDLVRYVETLAAGRGGRNE
jgi:mono/diheme cytochrome c family protein